jgi:acyl-CoA hydrolase/GNAT superfamily N-acetyltransferase
MWHIESSKLFQWIVIRFHLTGKLYLLKILLTRRQKIEYSRWFQISGNKKELGCHISLQLWTQLETVKQRIPLNIICEGKEMLWEEMVIPPEEVMQKIKPGMSIFLGTGVAEPRTLVKHLMTSNAKGLEDLELIQLFSFGDAITRKDLRTQKYRLKTFFTGWVAEDAIADGWVDLIPTRFAWIPQLIESKQIPIDVAFVQITPPDRTGNCSLGVSVDIARLAMEQATLTVGEISPQIPHTFGDTYVHTSDFDLLVRSEEAPIYFDRWPVDDVFDKVAANVEPFIEDGSCLAFSIGPLFEALGRRLSQKHDLGIHSPFFTDALMDLIDSGAVTNRKKEVFRGKSLASYVLGTAKLMTWLDRNPRVEFQGIENVFNPTQIGRNPQFEAILPVRKVDLTGRVALHIGKGNIATGPAEVLDFIHGAENSSGGHTIFALCSRNRNGEANIRISINEFPNHIDLRESVDMVVTEFGVAFLKGHTLRERAQSLIDIAHPDDRQKLVEQAKARKILYSDQIFLAEYTHLYPSAIASNHTFKGGVEVHFRAIKPSDEESMRRLFYRVSDMAIYSRYFAHIRTMPHAKMQEYVNVDWSQVMSIVGLVDEPDQGHIVAEARYIKNPFNDFAEVVFFVDEAYQGLGIATYLYRMLIQIAQERGVRGFTADVLSSNIGMMKVFKKGGIKIKSTMEKGVYELKMPFETQPAPMSNKPA